MEEKDKKEKFQFVKNVFSSKKKMVSIGIISIVVTVVIIMFCTIFALTNINNTKIISGVKINNIDVSNLSQEEANEKIQNLINDKKSEIIKLKKDEFENDLNVEQLEVNYNVEEAVKEAYDVGRKNNIVKNNFEILSCKNNEKNIDVEFQYNEENLENILNEINGTIPGAAKETSYFIEDSNLIITKGTEGNAINIEETKKSVKEELNKIESKEQEIELATEIKQPDAIDIEKIYNEIHTEPKDAYYTKDPFTIYPHVNGVDFAISMDEAKKIIEEEKNEYTIPLKITIPNITTDKLGSEAFPDLLGSYSTKYDGGNSDRTTNLRLAVGKLNGTVVNPGQTFSYNATLGERSIAAGYKEAKVYQGGKVVDGIGGGICQISSTLYNAVVYANLEVVSRKNHGFMTSYASAGRDATVVYGAIDFKFKNTRKYPIKIVGSVKNGIAKIDIYGVKEDPEYKVEFQTSVTETIPYTVTYIDDETLPVGKEVVEQKGANGCKSVTYKVLYLNGAAVSKKMLSSDTYNAMERVIRRGTATQTTEPVQQPATAEPTPQPTPQPTPEPTPTPEPSTPETNTTTENTTASE